jgi:hypothetical protein
VKSLETVAYNTGGSTGRILLAGRNMSYKVSGRNTTSCSKAVGCTDGQCHCRCKKAFLGAKAGVRSLQNGLLRPA